MSKTASDGGYPFGTGHWAAWSSERRIGWAKNFRTQLTKGGIGKKLGLSKKQIDESVASMKYLEESCRAEMHWSKWTTKEKLASTEKRYFYRQTGLRLMKDLNPGPGSIETAERELKDLEEIIVEQKRSLDAEEKWPGWTNKARAAYIRDTLARATRAGRSSAQRLGYTGRHLEELAVHAELLEVYDELGAADWDVEPAGVIVPKMERLLELLCWNGGDGARLLGKKPDFIGQTRQAIVTLKSRKLNRGAMSVTKAAVLREMEKSGDKIFEAFDKSSSKALYLPPSDILGKKTGN